MAPPKVAVAILLQRLRELRVRAGLTEGELEEKMILGPGWVSAFESSRIVPNLDLLLAMVHTLGGAPDTFFADLPVEGSGAEVERYLYALPDGDDLRVHFQYANHDARFLLPGADIEEFESVLKELRDGLAQLATDTHNEKSIKTQAVARTFLKAVSIWPDVNPSDLWWFVVYRAYLDPFNHAARFSRLDFDQSWKRTGGWALEEVLVKFYGKFLKQHGVRLLITSGTEKERLLRQLKTGDRLEADKADVLLVGRRDGKDDVCFGVVHVKASFAERRTDDVPMSKALVEAGYTSPLWTMDCKSVPEPMPVNRGELGAALPAGGADPDPRSAKRKDIEDSGYFSACFSYNWNTLPTPTKQKANARVVVCKFASPDDEFSNFIIERWKKFPR